MPLPKRKTSKWTRDMRRSHHKMADTGIAVCKQCNEPVRPHHVCENCGTYRGRKILNLEE